jgi:cytochrome c oxidase subunit II
MDRNTGLPFLPPMASAQAGPIDGVIWGINVIAIIFTLIIVVGIVYFSVKYRRGHKVDRSNPPLENLPIEIAWTVIPTVIVMVIYFWSSAVFLANKRMPVGATEISVVGKQWMWKLQHPEGRWEMNELHVPVGRPIKLTMTSEDVIHSFFVPAFRLHQDVIPGEYVQTWFTPTRVGAYHLFCAQFCGTNHSDMVGTVYVMDPADYQAWLATGSNQETLAQEGARLFIRHGCSGCHGGNASVRAPSLEGIYGKPVAVQIPPPGTPPQALVALLPKIQATTILADSRYIHDSIVLPEKEIAAGYRPIMPSFKNRLTEEEILKLVAYIRSLANTTGADIMSRQGPPSRGLSPEEYRARVGFTPSNIKSLTAGSAGQPEGAAPTGRAEARKELIYGNAGLNTGRTAR